MPQIQVYHNPNFLDYRGRHTDIVSPIQSVATIEVPEDMSVEQALEIAYRQTQQVTRSWWDNDGELLHVRSSSVGDVLAIAEGNLFVVESAGFRPYQPRAIRPAHRLAVAYRLLESAMTASECDQMTAVMTQVQHHLRHVLAAEGHPQRGRPILWDKAQVGDLIQDLDRGAFRLLARDLHPKWRARELLMHVPQAEIWIDGSQSWAVLVPVAKSPHLPS